ncbi:hypothetical protein BO71DRAFT_451253 [Aspergillus ellipticus CBS 707.79]|uniref:Phytanoyl-CoA dioxygenase n=1 Tax=Aspergillus ellipticus CBS 707.79 TaxID=1448320 RepID=A0A319DN34_9EURO|nr:hypothetical protein BO71DRAFT_451253 [Aspergillus ellipticus CBS 707.79]
MFLMLSPQNWTLCCFVSEAWFANCERASYHTVKDFLPALVTEFFGFGNQEVTSFIPQSRALEYQQRAFAWASSFSSAFNIDDPSTWTASNLPVQSKLITFDQYGVVHEKFMWDARLEPGVISAFAKIWETDELFVSFDSLNITFPNRQDKPPRAPWPHVDQSPFKRGLYCVQGIINLSSAGPEAGSLMCLPGSHALYDEFFDEHTDPATWETKDWRRFSEAEMGWWKAKGLSPMKVQAEPGDLILWDSRTLHWGGEPTSKSEVIRTIIYASYSPARLASPEAIEDKKRVFGVYGATTHWAHDNIFSRPNTARLPDGSVDPRNRERPAEMPDMTDQLKKLAGLVPY